MSEIRIKPIRRLEGEVELPGDKSISHRSVMVSALAEGNTRIVNFLEGEDCLNTVEAFRLLGVKIERKDKCLLVAGSGEKRLQKPPRPLYLGNSGTTMRLLLGILAGQSFTTVLEGDESLSRRPMKRVTIPLRKMGARITGADDANFAPLEITGGRLKGITYETPVASAQVKSALLFAGLYTGETVVVEPATSRDHTERMLRLFGAEIEFHGDAASRPGPNRVRLKGKQTLKAPASEILVPSDISSAAFFIVGASILPGSRVVLRNIGINPTRSHLLEILRRMGARIEIIRRESDYFEPMADLVVRSGDLKGVEITPEEVPLIIDELPILSVAAAFAGGKTEIRGAGELRVKETDRIKSMCVSLGKMGVDITELSDGLIIRGGRRPVGAVLESFGDHRTAMCGLIAGLGADGETVMKDTACIATSFPEFIPALESVSVR